MVEHLIQRGADVLSTTPAGDTVLHLALSQKHGEGMCRELVKRLIDAGCNTTACNSTGKTALEMAMQCDFVSVVELLDVPLPPDILLIAVQQSCTLQMVEHLIQRGADVLSTTPAGDTALHLALSQKYGEGMCRELVKRLINAGCNTTARNSTSKTALEMAMQRNFFSVVELLLPSNIPLPPDILLIAISQGSTLEMVKYLVQRGANCSTSCLGDSLLVALATPFRAEREHCELMRCLINAGCNLSMCDSKSNTAILLNAVDRDYSSVVKLLLSFNVPITPDILYTALRRRCRPQMIQVLVRKLRNNHYFESVSGSDWDTLFQLARTAYSRQYSPEVTQILRAAQKACRTHPSLEDETYELHVAKRPRLEA